MKTNKIIITVVVSVWLFSGCSTVKSWLGLGDSELQKEELVPPPAENGVAKNPDGTYNFTDEQLSNKRSRAWTDWVLLSVFLVSSGLIVRHVVKSKLK